MALVPHYSMYLVRETCVWALDVIGYWKLLFGACVLYGLHILQIALLRLIDGLFATRFFSSAFGSFFESVVWKVLQPLFDFVPGWVVGWNSGPALELPNGGAMVVHNGVTSIGDAIGRFEPLEFVLGGRATLAITFLIQVLVLIRRG